jgi:hypothetical protein
MNTNLRQPACNVRELQKPTGLDKTMHDLVLSRPKTQATKMRYKKTGAQKVRTRTRITCSFLQFPISEVLPIKIVIR